MWMRVSFRGRVGLLAAGVILAAAAAGCADPGGPGGGTGATLQPRVEISGDIPTVATVRWPWDGDEDVTAYVAFGTRDVDEFRAPARANADGEFESVLVGVKAATDVEYRAVIDDAGEEISSAVLTYRTGGLPPDLPRFESDEQLLDPSLAQASGFLLTSFVPGFPIVVDSDGDVVWWHDPGIGTSYTTTRLIHSPDGTWLYLVYTKGTVGGTWSDDRFALRISPAGTLVDTVLLPMVHHDMTELPDGTLAALMYDPAEIDGEEVSGDRLVEVSPDGAERDVWTTWDTVEYDPGSVPGGGVRWGHCNAIQYDPAADAYFVGCRHFDTIYKVDRATGDTLWRAGRTDGDFDILSGDEEHWYENQHQFRVLGDSLLVFDNGVQGGTETAAAEYQLGDGTAERTWYHQPDPPLGVYAFGDVHRFESGNTLINWSSAGRLEEVTPDGQVVRRLDLPIGTGLGYMRWVETLYP